MSWKLSDPLLTTGTAIVIAGQWLMAVAGAALVLSLPLLAFKEGEITRELQVELGNPTLVFPTLQAATALALTLVIVALMFLFFRNLRQIIATVGTGDPFVPANADRLTAMAWLMLAVQGLIVGVALLGYRIAKALSEQLLAFEKLDVDLSGIILVVTLFILARVFRQGAAMRADLEGTV